MKNINIAIFLYGLFFFLRRDKVEKEPVIFAIEIKKTGEYKILRFYPFANETHSTYFSIIQDLYNRGIREPLLLPDFSMLVESYKRCVP